MSVLARIKAPFDPLEALVYDSFIAPAVAAGFDKMFGETGALSGVADDARVLDVGCGGGQIAVAFAKRRPLAHVTAIDAAATQLARAQRRRSADGVDVDLRLGCAEALPFQDASFDFAFSIASIKHWRDPALGLREMARVLQPGGRMLVIDVDNSCSRADASFLIAGTRFPEIVKPLWREVFMQRVARPALAGATVLSWCAGLPLVDVNLARLRESPAFTLVATKEHA